MNSKLLIKVVIALAFILPLLILGKWYWKSEELGPVLPPLYLSQMEACEQEGGQVRRESTKAPGGYQALSRWQCDCKSGQAFFGENSLSERLQCNQWFEPAIR